MKDLWESTLIRLRERLAPETFATQIAEIELGEFGEVRGEGELSQIIVAQI